MKIAGSALELVGNTPLVRLNRIAAGSSAQVVAKLEFYAPGASVKDRIGVAMIDASERAGTLKHGMTVVEPTTVHTGIALAWVCAVKGDPCIRFIPDPLPLPPHALSRP